MSWLDCIYPLGFYFKWIGNFHIGKKNKKHSPSVFFFPSKTAWFDILKNYEQPIYFKGTMEISLHINLDLFLNDFVNPFNSYSG